MPTFRGKVFSREELEKEMKKTLTTNDMFEIGMENAEATVTNAATEHRQYLYSHGAERCEECGIITCTPVWVIRRYLCRECARTFGRRS